MTAGDELQLGAAYIDVQIERVLNAAGSSLKHYMPSSKDKLRETMRLVLTEDRALAAQADGVKQ